MNKLSEGISISFMKDTVSVMPGKFGLNSIIITNRSEQETVLTALIETPDELRLLSKVPKKIILAPNEEEVFPIRLGSTGREIGGKAYPVRITLTDERQAVNVVESYTFQPVSVSNWQADVIESLLFFPAEGRPEIRIRFQNIGNTIEEINIEPRKVPDAFKFESDSIKVILPPGADTVVLIPTSFKINQYKGPDEYVSFFITNSGENSKLRVLTQEFMPSAHEIKKNRYRWFYTDINADVYYQTLPNEGGFLFSSFSGSVPLHKNRSLNYTWRSNITTGSSAAGTNQFFNVDYRAKRLRLRLGNQSDFYERIITGFGGRAELVLPKNEFEVLGVRDRIRNTVNFHGKYTFKPTKNIGVAAYTNFERDNNRSNNTSLQSLRYTQKIGRKTRLEARAAYGAEDFETREENRRFDGFSFTTDFNAETAKYRYQFGNYYSSSFFPGRLRGVTTLVARVNRKSGNWFYGPVFTRSRNNPKFFENEDIREELFADSRLYEFEAGIRKRGLFVTLAPGYSTDNQETASAEFYGVRFNTLWQTSKGLGIGASTTAGSWRLKGENGSSFFRHNTSVNISYRGFGIDARFRDGPFFLNDLNRFVADTALNETLVSLYMRKELFNNKLQTFLRAEYNTGNDFDEAYVLASDIEYQFSRSFAVRFNVLYNSSFENRKITFAAGIRKKLRLPLIGLSKYKTLTAIMFKDANSNGRFDRNEEPISGAALKVGDIYLTTDAAGRAVYKNIEPKVYNIDLTPVSVIEGWYFPRGRVRQVIVNKNTEYLIPFEKNHIMTGRIEAEKAKYSKYKYSLSGIRVTAVDSAGRVHNTFTEDDGSFRMNLPGGNWKVNFNTVVLGDKFDIIAGEQEISFTNNKSAEVIFRIREKKRKLNIKKKE